MTQWGYFMKCDIERIQEHDIAVNILIYELLKRSTPAPVKTKRGNDCILVDMSDCSHGFQKAVEAFFAESDRFRIHVRGLEYYVEVLHGDSFAEAFNKSML